jgi:hypothetical protein
MTSHELARKLLEMPDIPAVRYDSKFNVVVMEVWTDTMYLDDHGELWEERDSSVGSFPVQVALIL